MGCSSVKIISRNKRKEFLRGHVTLCSEILIILLLLKYLYILELNQFKSSFIRDLSDMEIYSNDVIFKRI